jgi:hypothetical protein
MKYDESLIIFLKKLYLEHRFRFCRSIREFYPDILKKIYDCTLFLDDSDTLSERIYCITHNIYEKKLCPVCNKKRLKYINFIDGYRLNCSTKCSKHNPKTKEKYRKTYKEKYGIETDCNFNLPNYYKNNKTILLKKYGVDNVSKLDFVKNKKRETFQKNHENTLIPKWGNTWYDITLPSGKKVKVQGYERFAIPYLLKEYEENDLFISNSDIKKQIGVINYIYKNRYYVYYPDLYIKSKNKVIEIKSKYTLTNHLQILSLKKKSVIERGLYFDIIVMNYKGENITNSKEVMDIIEKL